MDEVLETAPVETAPVETTPVETTPVETQTTPVPDDEAMWGDLKPDTPDPNEPPAVPAEYAKALQTSEYVREPAHLEAAVRTASELWDVVEGKKTATSLLEGLRSQNPTQYEKTVMEDIIPYIEKITGKKFGGEQTAPDPVAELQAKIAEMERRPQLEAQQREQQQFIQRAEQTGGQKVEELIKGGNGIFDGDVQGAIQSVAAQYAKLGLDGNVVMKEVAAGNFTNLERAYKAAEKAETLKAKAYSDRVKAKYLTLKRAVPASTGGSSNINPGSDNSDMTTQPGRVKWMTEQFKAGN